MPTVTLRPNATGDLFELSTFPEQPNNYACVDEAVANDDTDYVTTGDYIEEKDLYGMENLPAGVGTISGIVL